MTQFPGLLKRAQWGKVTETELADVAKCLSLGECDDIYEALHIIGRGGSPKYRSVMENYLRCQTDPQVAALALKVLFNWWGLGLDYRDDLISFLRGVEWDIGDWVRLQAISSAGELLRSHSDTEVLQLLYDIFSNPLERKELRGPAYFALCRSEGAEWKDIPPASRILEFSRDVDASIVARVKNRLSKKLH
jgi:hypothetical protein